MRVSWQTFDTAISVRRFVGAYKTRNSSKYCCAAAFAGRSVNFFNLINLPSGTTLQARGMEIARGRNF